MTQPTHDEVIAWIDEKVKSFTFYRSKINGAEIAIASLLANRAGLERHKPEEVGGQVFCFACESDTEYDNNHLFPCPSYTDIAEPIRSVMG